MAATIGQKHKNGFKIVEIWDNHSESLKNNLYNDFKGPEHLLGGMNLENEIDTCQTTVHIRFCVCATSCPWSLSSVTLLQVFNFEIKLKPCCRIVGPV